MAEWNTIPQIVENALEWNQKLNEVLTSARVNLKLLEGDVQTLQDQKDALIKDKKTLEVRNASLNREISEKLQEAERKANAIIADAENYSADKVSSLDEFEKFCKGVHAEEFKKLRKKALEKREPVAA